VLNISLTDQDRKQLKTTQANHPHHILRRRALIILLKDENIPHHKIASITNVCDNTVTHCLEAYQQGGIDLLMTINFRKPESQLKSFDVEIKKYFEKNPPISIAQACAEIKKLTNVSIKNTQMRTYVKSLGLRYRKVNSIPAKANIEAQKEFHDKQLQPRLEEAKAGNRAVYFVDAAHFVLGAFLGYLWSFIRVFVRTPSGRQRFNVLGALNAITKELTTITNDSYITSIQVCELLKQLAKKTKIPITLVLDNARYQRCHLVMALAKELKIELLFLPPYSPNLNLIERLWKFIKKECLYSKYYENFSLFKGAIQKVIFNMHKTHRKKLKTLLTLRFQTFTDEQLQYAI
jgi:transposase